MASSGTVTIAAQVSGLSTGSKNFAVSYGPFTGAVDETLDVTLVANTPQTITSPLGSTWALIVPGTLAGYLHLRGDPGDIGYGLSLTKVTALPVDGQSIFTLVSNNNGTLSIVFV